MEERKFKLIVESRKLQKSSFKTDSCKHRFKSPREGDNDDDNHETIDMIRQQMYGPRGPYENLLANQTEKGSFSSPEQSQSNLENEEEPAYSQSPVKKRKLDFFKHCEIFKHTGSTSELTPVSPRERDNDEDNRKNVDTKSLQVKHRRGHNNREDKNETTFSQSPAKKRKRGTSDFNEHAILELIDTMPRLMLVDRRPNSSFSTGWHRRPFISPRQGDNDGDNHETSLIVHQQRYGPGGYYGILKVKTMSMFPSSKTLQAKHKRCQDEKGESTFRQPPAEKPSHGFYGNMPVKHVQFQDYHEEEEDDASNQQPAKKARLDALDFGPKILKSVNRQPTSNCNTDSQDMHVILHYFYQLTVYILLSHLKLHHDNDDDDDSSQTPVVFGPQPLYDPELPLSCGDMLGQHSLYSRDGTEICEFKVSADGDRNPDYKKAFKLFYPTNSIPDYPDDTEPHCSKKIFAYRKQCRDKKDQGETAYSQQMYSHRGPYGNWMVSPRDIETRTKAFPIDQKGYSKDCEPAAISQQPANKPRLKRQNKSPRTDDNDEDNHETLAMIRQQMYSPRGPYGNRRVSQTNSESGCTKTLPSDRKRCRDDREDEEEASFCQQPAKKPRLKRQNKSPRTDDNDEDNHETLAMIRQQMYSPGGPYGNRIVSQTDSESGCTKTVPSDRKRCRDVSQQPAENPRLKH